MSIYSHLTDQEGDELNRIAQKERRTSKQQAAFWIAEGIKAYQQMERRIGEYERSDVPRGIDNGEPKP